MKESQHHPGNRVSPLLHKASDRKKSCHSFSRREELTGQEENPVEEESSRYKANLDGTIARPPTNDSMSLVRKFNERAENLFTCSSSSASSRQHRRLGHLSREIDAAHKIGGTGRQGLLVETMMSHISPNTAASEGGNIKRVEGETETSGSKVEPAARRSSEAAACSTGSGNPSCDETNGVLMGAPNIAWARDD